MLIEQILEALLYNLNVSRKNIGDKIVFTKLGIESNPISLNNNDLDNEIFNFYLSKYSKSFENDSIIIQNYINYVNQENFDLDQLQDLYQIITSIIFFINDTLNNLRREKMKDFKTTDFYTLSLLDSEFPNIKQKMVKDIVEYLEDFIKIRGDYIGEEINQNALEIVNYLKSGDFQSPKIKEIDELYYDIIKRIQDYEYYIISKDRVFTVVPASYIWFEYIMHVYYMYENQINFNSFLHLYEKRLLPSFEICRNWYKVLYNQVIANSHEKDNLYNEIMDNISEIENFLQKLHLNIKEKYPNKEEIDEQFFSQKLYDLLNKTENFQKISKKLEENKLKNTGIFQNIYSILKEIYAERETILTLYEFHNNLLSTINYLEEYDPDFLTPLDKKVLDNKDKFLFILDIISKYLNELNKDYIIEMIEYLEKEIEPILLDIKEDYVKLEKLLEPEKIVCLNCGHKNDPYNEFCVKCGKKLLKVKTESKSAIKNIFSKLSMANIEEAKSISIILMNILNNSLSGLENIKSTIEQLQGDNISEIIEKINSILEDIMYIREKISLFINDQIKEEEISNIIQELEPIVEELDQRIENLYSFIKSLS